MQWIKAKDEYPKLYQPVLCILENKGEYTRYPLMCFMNVHNEWLDMYSNKIDEQKVTVCYWAAIQDWSLDNIVPCSARDEDIEL